MNQLVKKLRSTFPMNSKIEKNNNKTKTENTDKSMDEEIDDSLAEVLQRVKKTKKMKNTIVSLPDINLDELVRLFFPLNSVLVTKFVFIY